MHGMHDDMRCDSCNLTMLQVVYIERFTKAEVGTMDSSWVIIGGVIVVMAAILVYIVLMIFLPEWVGITGRAALDAERSHADENLKKNAVKDHGTEELNQNSKNDPV
jgi:uncharacterized membrane protein